MIAIASNVLYIKIDDQKEIPSTAITKNLVFLGLTEHPNLVNNYRDDILQDGELWNYARYSNSVVTAKFVVTFLNRRDFKLAKHEIYRVFAQKGIFRLRTGVEPDVVRFCRSVSFEMNTEPNGPNYCEFEIPFENPSGLRYSRMNTDKMTPENIASFNMDLLDEVCQYHFTGKSSFKIYNAGNINVDAVHQNHDFKITMKHNGGKFTLKNTTTNTSWTYNKNLTGSDVIILEGNRTSKNEKPDSANTDYGYITLAPWWNTFTVSGANDLDIVFSFPYMYLG